MAEPPSTPTHDPAFSLCRQLAATTEQETAIALVLDHIVRGSRADRVGLIAQPDRGEPTRSVVIEPDREGGARGVLPLEITASTLALGEVQQREPLFRTGVGHPEHLEDQMLAQQGYRDRIYLPLWWQERWVGVLSLSWRSSGGLTKQKVQWLEEMAAFLALVLDDARARTEAVRLQDRLERESGYLRNEIKGERDLRLLTGESPAMKAARLAIQQVARTDSTVLITGETGTGKELVARSIHQLSPRRDRLLVSVNCAALAPSIIASELFGHEAGAFTGALKRRVGRFELAQGGTIFLDEIGEIPAEIQALLLRVLQERSMERVGGSEPLSLDVRVIAATNRDLERAVNEGRFRADLYFRLNVFPIAVPPLRQRREDIPSLVQHFLRQLNRRVRKLVSKIEPASLRLLQQYAWPGNVRELENVIERAMIVSTGETLFIDASWFAGPSRAVPAPASTLADVEREAIHNALKRAGGRIYGPSGAAAILGMKPTTLYSKMRKLGIPRQNNVLPDDPSSL